MIEIHVKYEAETELAQPAAFEELIRKKIEDHIRSIHEVPVHNGSIEIVVTRLLVKANQGSMTLLLSGNVNDNEIKEQTIVADDRPPSSDSSEPFRELTKLAFANCFILVRSIFWQSEFSRAVGGRRTNDRARRAFDDSMADIRIAVDKALDRPKTNGLKIWKSTLKHSFLCSLAAAAIAGIFYWLNGANVADSVRAGFSCILIPISLFGMLIGWGLIRLPDQFYLSERPGRKLVKLIGVKKIISIRFVATFMMCISAAIFAVGIYWLFVE